MCCRNKHVTLSSCTKDFAYDSVLTFSKIFGRKAKACACDNDKNEHFQSPFALKSVKAPSWIAHHNQVLRFFAYFQEPIPESALETYRVHHVHILYHLEDDTVAITEPLTYDPGFPQGKLLRRQKVPLREPCHDAFVTLDHINVGCDLEVYGKTFHVTGCDAFTRRFLNRRGVPVPLDVQPPCDLATEKRKEDLVHTLMTRRTGIQGCRMVEKGLQFLTNTRRVLRFWGYWDDRCSYLGRLRKFALHFHLEDDTLEVTEVLEEDDAGVNPLFLKRQRLLKNSEDLVHLPGFTEEGFEVLNTSRLVDQCGEFTGQAFLTDRLYTGHTPREYYKAHDLAIGATINVYGRAFILTDADEFTKVFYRDKYGVQDFTPLVLDQSECRTSPAQAHSSGCCGTELDDKSLEKWGRRDTMPNSHDFRNLMADKDILVFSAILDSPQHKVNSERRFTIKYFLLDATFQILEHSHPNSGFKRGIFLARSRFKKPTTQRKSGACATCSDFYEPCDLYVGNTLEINGFTFVLMSAEECTLSFMESNHRLFPQSNLCQILNKVREAFGPHPASDILLAFSANDAEKQGVISARDFRCLVLDLTKESLNEHEVKTLIRGFRVTHPRGSADLDTLQSIFHTELRKFRFDRTLLQRLEYNFRHYDACHTGTIERTLLRQMLKGARIPVRPEFIDFLVDHFPAADSCCRVNYCQLMKFLDWETYEIPSAKPAAVACVLRHLCPQPPPVIDCVNYRAFLDEVCPNIRCALPVVVCPCPPAEYAAQAGCHQEQEAHLRCMEPPPDQCRGDEGQGHGGQGSGTCPEAVGGQPEVAEGQKDEAGLHEFFGN